MSEKCLKSDIYVNETVVNVSCEQAIDVDFTLPDYCPDISRIFKCRALPRISGKALNGKTVTVDGSIAITLLYSDKDGGFRSFEYPFPFSKEIEIKDGADGGNVFCRIRCDYINCRAVTGRKVDIHGAAGIGIRVVKRCRNEIISDIDDAGIEVKRTVAPATLPMGYSEKYLTLEEDIRLGDGQPPIESILKTDSAISVRETRVISGKVVVKGELTVCILYSGTDGMPQAVKTVLPFSQIVDVDGITDSCECDSKAQIASLEINPKTTSGGEIKCFSLEAKILLTNEAYCNNDITVITDAFSRKYEADISRRTLNFDKIIRNVNEKFTAKKNIELESPINSVTDLWCSVISSTARFENDNMKVSGTLSAGMIVTDENGRSLYYEKPIDFEYVSPYAPSGGIPHSEPDIEVVSNSFTITSANNIEIRSELSVNAAVYEKNEVSLITEMKVDETKVIKRENQSAMVLYFPTENESVWDIANKFGASTSEISDINSIDKDAVAPGKVMLIPLD